MAVAGLDALKDQGDACKCPPGHLELLIAGLHSKNCPLRWKNDE